MDFLGQACVLAAVNAARLGDCWPGVVLARTPYTEYLLVVRVQIRSNFRLPF